MKKYFLLLLLVLLFTSCTSTKVDLRKTNLADINIIFETYNFSDFTSGKKLAHHYEAYNLATTESQKTAAKGIEYIIQNRY